MFDLNIQSQLKKYARKRPLRFHMPGHKGKGKSLKIQHDVTEIDYLDIGTAVETAEKDIAKIYNAPFCRILSDGATSGIFSMLYAVKHLGKSIIINRTAHKSVYNALTVFGIEPIIVGGIDEDFLPKILTDEETETALIKNPDAIGVFYTYPDYYGRNFDIEKISQIVKKYGKPLLVDNAHGTHYNFSDKAVYAGKYASMWVDGAHKTLPTLNQGAIVFCGEQSLIENLNDAVEMFSTTSPSYLIKSSVEYGVKYQQFVGRKIIDNKIIPILAKLKQKLESLGIKILQTEDFFKLVIDFDKSLINAIKAEEILNKEGIFPELNDGKRVLFMFSSATSKKEFKRLFRAVKKIVAIKSNSQSKRVIELNPQREMDYLTAKKSSGEMIDLSFAEGRISACDFGIFPPCYPLVLAGEVITKNVIEIMNSAPQTFGVKNGVVRVIKENER